MGQEARHPLRLSPTARRVRDGIARPFCARGQYAGQAGRTSCGRQHRPCRHARRPACMRVHTVSPTRYPSVWSAAPSRIILSLSRGLLPQFTKVVGNAQLSAPGGILDTGLGASRIAAFRPLYTVGLPSRPREDYPVDHDSTSFGAPSRGLLPRFLQLRTPMIGGGTWRALLTCWLGVGQMGFAPCGVHPLGHNNPFHRIAPTPKVSGLPWHEQRVVRPGFREDPEGQS